MRESLAVAHEVRAELGPVSAVDAVADEPPLVLPPRDGVRRGLLRYDGRGRGGGGGRRWRRLRWDSEQTLNDRVWIE